jgi:predicted DNA-binding protein
MRYKKYQQTEYCKLSIAPTPPLLFSQQGQPNMETKTRQLGVRFSDEDFLRIAAAAQATQMTPTAWLRLQALRSLDGFREIPTWKPPPATVTTKLTHTAGTRFTREQMEALRAHARACGLPPTTYIRQIILGAKPIARMPDVRLAIAAINRVGNNLNQLVHLAHSGVILTPDLVRTVLDVRAELHALQKLLLDRDR